MIRSVDVGMGYIESHLTADEKVIYQTRLSCILFLPSFALCLVVVIAAFALKRVEHGDIVVMALWCILLVKTVSTILTFFTSEFAITNKRVLGKTGFFTVESLDILLGKVEAVRVNRGINGQIFGYGNIEVTGTGGTHEVLRNIPSPALFRLVLQEQLDLHSAHSRVDSYKGVVAA